MPETPQGFGEETSKDDLEATKKMVTDLFEKAKNHRSKYDEKWLEYYKFFRGRQWQELRPSYRHSEVINMIFQNIQSVVPILTDARPKPQYLPTEPSDRPFAEILDKITDYDWTRNNCLDELTQMLYDGHIYGTGFFKVLYDKDMDMGLGGVELSTADPFYCYPDPEALDVNKKCKYFIYAEPMDVKELKRLYPEHKDEIKSDIHDYAEYDRTNLEQIKYRTPSSQAITFGTASANVYKTDLAMRIMCWMSDEMSEISEEEVAKEDGTTETIRKKKYPRGRKITIAGGCVVEDVENPYEDGKFPYAKYSNYLLPREFWGISEIEPLQGPQKIFNKLVSFSLDVLTLMGNPVWIVDTTSGIDVENLVNRPGLIIEKEPNSEVRREEGVNLQPYVMQLVDRMKIWFDQISGANDVTRGVQPVGVKAGVAIEALQEAAQTRIRQKSRNLDTCLQEVGKLWVSRVLQFYTVPRVVRITNDQNASEYFKFHVEEVDNGDGTYKKIAKIKQIFESPQGPVDGEEYVHEIKGQFDVRITTGTTLPFARGERLAKALDLYDRQIVDAEEVLNAADYPNKEAILQRLQEKQAAMAAQQPPPKGA